MASSLTRALAVAALLAACSGARSPAHPSAKPAATTSTTAANGTTLPTARPDDWPVYHGDGARDGVSSAGPSAAHVVWTAHVDGAIYGQPVAADGIVVVATEHNVVAAIDETSGAVRWSRTIGTPVDASTLPCGDVAPSGTTATPAIDPETKTVYVVSFLSPAHHVLTALNLTTGTVVGQVTIDPPGLSPKVEQQRGAVALANGRVYIPYGGLYGDCGPYKGAVVSVAAAGLTGEQSWETTAKREGGLWATPGPVVAADGTLFVATGNAGDSGSFDGGDAVVHLSADLRQLDIFGPSNWQALAAADADLGSTSPILSGHTVVQIGKTGVAYLLDPAHLGGVGGQTSEVRACNATFGGGASDQATGTVFLPCRNGVTALRGGAVLWHSPVFTAGGPVVIGGSVWVPSLDTGDLLALDPATGAVRSRTQIGTFAHFATVGFGGGHLLVATIDGAVSALS